ncbi:MAG: hypothetical protein ACI88C_000018 [Acidimicrobiales bacterium]|jgi:hypothetical protein
MGELKPAQLMLKIAELRVDVERLTALVAALSEDNTFLEQRVKACGGSLKLRPESSSSSSSSEPSETVDG